MRGVPRERRALQVALLNQIGLDHVLDGVALFANGGGHVVQTDRPAIKSMDDGLQQLAVHHVKTH